MVMSGWGQSVRALVGEFLLLMFLLFLFLLLLFLLFLLLLLLLLFLLFPAMRLLVGLAGPGWLGLLWVMVLTEVRLLVGLAGPAWLGLSLSLSLSLCLSLASCYLSSLLACSRLLRAPFFLAWGPLRSKSELTTGLRSLKNQ